MIPLHDDNPTRVFPIVTVTVIALCVVVFLWQLSLGRDGGWAVYAFGLIPAVLLGDRALPPEIALLPPTATVFTSMFMHGGWMHLIGNMLYLWIFGNNVEDAMGHWRFVVFYLVAGVGAALAQAFLNPASSVPMIGASGAISGVLGAYLLLYPHARVMVLIFLGIFARILYPPALFVLGFWFVLQFVNAMMTKGGGGGVAFWAHVGGFVAGVALIPIFRDRRVPLFGGARQRRKGPWDTRRRGPWG